MQSTWHPYEIFDNLCSYWEDVEVKEDWRSDSTIYTGD